MKKKVSDEFVEQKKHDIEEMNLELSEALYVMRCECGMTLAQLARKAGLPFERLGHLAEYYFALPPKSKKKNCDLLTFVVAAAACGKRIRLVIEDRKPQKT